LGGIFQQQGKFDDAIAAFQRRIQISESLNDERSAAIAVNLGQIIDDYI
jgi:hypothetical protein